MKEENCGYKQKIQLWNKGFIAKFSLLISISYLQRLAEKGINILLNEKLMTDVKVFERHIVQAFHLLNEINLNNKEIEDLYNRFEFILEILEVREKLISLNYIFDNSDGDSLINNIRGKLDLDDVNLILRHITKNQDLMISIKNMFFEKLTL